MFAHDTHCLPAVHCAKRLPRPEDGGRPARCGPSSFQGDRDRGSWGPFAPPGFVQHRQHHELERKIYGLRLKLAAILDSPDVASEPSIAEKIAKIANQHCVQFRPRSLSRDRGRFLRKQDTTKMNYERVD